MRYRLADLPALLATPAGRMQIGAGIAYRLWPVAAALADAYRRTLVRRTRVVAVVGSLGKSTTARAVAAALALPEHPRMLANSWTRVAAAVLRIRPRARRAVIEVGIAAPGQMVRYARIVRPDVTVVTAIASEHQRSFGTPEAIRTEKAWMVRVLAPTAMAVLNGDDPNVLWMRATTPAPVVTFGFGESCDVRAIDFRLDWPHGTRFTLLAAAERREVAIALFGRPSAYAVLAAIAVAQAEGVTLDDAVARLARMTPTPGRMQPVMVADGITFLRDEFKSTLESIHAALDTFAEIPARRRIVLLGGVSEPPGPQGPLYAQLGERVAAIATHLVVVGHRKQYERYATGARRAGMARESIIEGGRTPEAVARCLGALLQPGDVVLAKGRDTQRLDRIRLHLAGRSVRCDIEHCSLRTVQCESCPMLERGWNGRRAVMR